MMLFSDGGTDRMWADGSRVEEEEWMKGQEEGKCNSITSS